VHPSLVLILAPAMLDKTTNYHLMVIVGVTS
jgi:hypothetical protein